MITKMVHKATPVTTTDPVTGISTQRILPAGCRVYLNSTATQYSSRYWPDPLKLDPSRWSSPVAATDEKKKTADGKKVVAADKTRQMRGTFLTFSDGSRACLGRKFAQAEYIGFLVALLKDFRVVLGEGMDAEQVEKDLYLRCAGKVTLSPLDNVRLGLRRRE